MGLVVFPKELPMHTKVHLKPTLEKTVSGPVAAAIKTGPERVRCTSRKQLT
jgi:hypothetical protein